MRRIDIAVVFASLVVASAAVTAQIDLAGPWGQRFHEDLPERGSLRGWTKAAVLDLLRALEGAGLVEASRGEYPTISTTRRGDQVAIGSIDPDDVGVSLVRSAPRARKPRGPRRRSRS